ncbi:MAG: calcium-translocating P-type ATPase, PMCA-type [Nanoarchaeota archaeon]|nr:calcium-translocating P-type ATPase, PMCA-type [Nanoarchaeota archaeon]MBU1004761.1 calcium-translocating P-type ATPase, PMCA-type [Nanoarchaeota archaeon]MBU1946620.1 calcium-translocating P-type ATPase, PMCA-type [Nanoarchaeota archaeon]
MPEDYYSIDIKELMKQLKTSEKGLTTKEAQKRTEQYGLNEIEEKKQISPFKIFFSQFASFIVYVLIAALVISIITGEKIDAIVIGFILILNAVMGFIQEYKAEKAIEALKKMASLKAKVLRDGKEQKIQTSQLVPGDIIILETGDKVPADARLIEITDIQTQEAALTGESLPVKKAIGTLDEKTPVADRYNMVFSSTIVTKGKAKAVITSTGMNSEIGKIAELIQKTEETITPLQEKLEHMGKFLGIAVIIIAAIVFLVGILRAKLTPLDMLIASIALAVAAIPEGLPAVVTISLALGVQRMVKRNALVRKLHSVETLGSTTVICSDKTGTLTCNEMTVRKIYANNETIDVTGEGYSPKGNFHINNKKIDPKECSLLLQAGALCNDARFTNKENLGDPTELAIIISAEKAGLKKDQLEKKYPRTGEIQFTSERKLMSTFHKIGNKKVIYSKGAPEVILKACNRILINGKIRQLKGSERYNILKINEKFAESALRVLGFAYNEGSSTEKDLIFLGLQAMMDPPRPEVREAINKCKKAGIKVVMITGDHITTAKAVAKELGISGKAIEGKDIDKIKNLEKEVEGITIYARVNPEHKSKIIDALRKNDHIISMTGDGVNDAPALKKADIGIAMGITGTDVSKEASHMILVDDNFASIVNAIEEGRTIFDNIKIFLIYLLSGNSGELLSVFIAILVGLPLPLLALQILWINVVTETIIAISLSKEPPEDDLMSRPPKKNKEQLLNRKDVWWMICIALLISIGTLSIFVYSLTKTGWHFTDKLDLANPSKGYTYALTMAFNTFVLFQIFNVFNCKSPRKSVFFKEFYNNKWLLAAISIALALQIAVIYSPYLNILLKTTPLALTDWILSVIVASSVLWFGELLKLIGLKRD